MTKTNAEEIAAEEKDKNARDERKKKWNATQWMCFAIVLIPLVAVRDFQRLSHSDFVCFHVHGHA